jgi:transposase
MPAKLYIVDLTEEERRTLLNLIRKGKSSARKMTRARILLKADEGMKDAEVAQALNTHRTTVERIRKRFVEGGLDKALNENPRPGQQLKLDEKAEAHLIAIACSDAPGGDDHWSLRLLAGKMVELGYVESISHETIRQYLEKKC